ncbi:type 1 glutamine amidotransferase [Brevundimonas poindexterae]|uniref:type 1 glutamine amidotransferase n=1 Tax=Brevundimonas poindexterae TaxID=74325 RepID=UPI001CFDF693|nr:homoserine O-succinyltransferase [Brevundimonas poindexterae]
MTEPRKPCIAILETGAPPSDLAPAHGRYPQMFRRLLGEEFETRGVDVRHSPPPDPEAFDGVIITGSPAGVYDGEPWIGRLLDWIASAKGRTRMVGICFGHQAMAQALGGRVEKSDRGWGVGLHRYDVQATEPWMQPPLSTIAIPVSHQDQVVERPAGARVILSSDFTPFAGLAWDDDAISMQCHPEFTPAFAAALAEGRRDRIGADRVDPALDTLKGDNDRDAVGRWIRTFLKG